METKICEKCGKKMIKIGTGFVLTSYPPQYPMKWWCGCGHEESAGMERGKTEEEMNRENWEKENL